ncbi:NAD(P)H-quinone oxidoreductase [Sedimenticola hydrogenitrophicus]|uniref:NAD(P)H-quinone oxidoreductase n=1 Tax=Sedimenticola hydrogenitrophicus TaxID=2967975 RepID=UPI0023AFD4E7|nr:NAD(P)H-quinone oxidoreductase [Sedimenticola hydrogenitrophicus]
MKAILIDEFGGPEVLSFAEVERPTPQSGQVLIKVAATSVNRPDLVQREGKYPAPPGESPILGLEVAGTIEEIADSESPWRVGDRVMSLVAGGGYAEYALAYTGHVMPVPESMRFEEAACVCETYITAYLNLFMIGGLVNGGSALIHGGGGGVNTAALHLCANLVPQARTLVTASPQKIERVKALGADLVINYREQDFAEEVKAFTHKRGVDVILDHIGAPYLASNMKSLALCGRLVSIGVTGGIKAEINLALLMVKRQQLIGSVLRSRPVEEKSEIVAAFSKAVIPFLADRSIVPLVHEVYPLSEAAQAHRAMEASSHFGKLVLAVA